MTDNPLYAPRFTILNLSAEELAKAPPGVNSYAAMAETRRYVEHVRTLGGFSGPVSEEVEITNWRVPEGAFTYTNGKMRVLPVYHPYDMMETIQTVAEKCGDDMKKQFRKFRAIFQEPAEEILNAVGTDPQEIEKREVLEFMLRGAMHNYSDKKTLSQNAAQFSFDRENAKMLKEKKNPQPLKKPGEKLGY